MIIRAGNEISVGTHFQVRRLVIAIEQLKIPGLLDIVPSYTEVMVCYDPAITNYKTLRELLEETSQHADTIELPRSSVLQVPVMYGGEYGPDLQEVAAKTNLTEPEVIRIHTSVDYLVYMLGFTPGFCYLGGLNQKIATERRQNPRLKIPAGAVGIAGNQTGIYPIESPGGWQIIGQTPIKLFDPHGEPVFLASAGDYIRFISVNRDEFSRISNEVNRGSYEVQKTEQQ
jgi:inhibitor of KinA